MIGFRDQNADFVLSCGFWDSDRLQYTYEVLCVWIPQIASIPRTLLRIPQNRALLKQFRATLKFNYLFLETAEKIEVKY